MVPSLSLNLHRSMGKALRPLLRRDGDAHVLCTMFLLLKCMRPRLYMGGGNGESPNGSSAPLPKSPHGRALARGGGGALRGGGAGHCARCHRSDAGDALCFCPHRSRTVATGSLPLPLPASLRAFAAHALGLGSFMRRLCVRCSECGRAAVLQAMARTSARSQHHERIFATASSA
eukprot:2449558-Pleurochrysis_carterae.AAC.2